MKNVPSVLPLLLITLLLAAGPALAAEIAEIDMGDAGIEWQPTGAYESLSLSISGPDGFQLEKRFPAGTNPNFYLFDADGNAVFDGSYTWELRLTPSFSAADRAALAAERAEDPGSTARIQAGAERLNAVTQSGTFTVADGRLVSPASEEGEPTDPEKAAAAVTSEGEPTDPEVTGTAPTKDQQILDDLIVDGSACVGQDCVNGESFGFDTIRIKENNLRIKAQDTSSTASFPSNDWQITFNESSNGGANKFSIDDIDGGRTPFTIEASAPSHSLYVDDGGRLGFGTSTPVADLHVKSGNTPTLRLEQDGTSGFSAQIWDVAGNEANFFIRDASNGSTLPFRLFPGAPSNALSIEASGDVGIGTTSPAERLQISGNSNPGFGIINTSNSAAWNVRVGGNDILNISRDGTGGAEVTIDDDGTFSVGPGAAFVFTVSPTGNVSTDGDFISGGMTLNVPDYVFEADYSLMPLPELAAFIAENKHLPNIPSASEVSSSGKLNMSQMQMKLLEKIEELTLYTLAQQETIQKLEARLEAVESGEVE